MGFTHFIVRLTNIARVAPGRVGDFIRSPQFEGDHIFKGEPIPIEQFNDVVPALLEKHKRSWVKLPIVELISLSEKKKGLSASPASSKEEKPQPEKPAPVKDQAPDPAEKKAAPQKAAPTIDDDEIARE